MKKPLLFLLFLVPIFGWIFLNNSSENSRKEYESYLRGELDAYKKQIPEGDLSEKALGQPDMAALQEYFQVMDPKEKRVPQERLVLANKQMKNIQEANYQKNVQGLEWENIPSNMGGRTRALLWDPNSASGNKVWAGSVTGGIWYNNDITNPNSEWHAVDDMMSSLSISSLCYDPNNTNIFYAGTGEAPTAIITYRESSGRGIGIWKSEDGGENWSLLESTQDFAYITDIEIRNENGISVIYAGVASGKYMGEDQVSLPNDGLYRSENGGQSWEQVLPIIPNAAVPYTPADIEIGADRRIYIGTMKNIESRGGGTILFSDAGLENTWTVNEEYKLEIESGLNGYYIPGRVMIGAAPSDENVVYAIIGAGYLDGWGYYHGNYVLRSSNKGESWENKNIPTNNPTWASLSWHAFAIDVDPNDANHFYVGGLDEYHSLNGGTSYYHVSDWAMMYYGGGDDYIHADQHIIRFKPGSSDEVIFGTDGGVFYTNNATNNLPEFQEMNHYYSTLQFYTCDLHPINDKFIGGLQDNGTLFYDGDPLDISTMFYGGDGAYCFFDQVQPNYYIGSYYYNRYGIFNNGNQIGYLGNEETGTFVSAAAYDSDDHILYANGVGFFGQDPNTLFRGKDVTTGPNSTLIDLSTNIDTWFTHVAYSPYSPLTKSTLFIGSLAGDLFRVDNAQSLPEVTEIGSDDFPTASISCIAIGGSEDTLLVTFSNYGVSSIWQTYDGGEQWSEVEGNLPDMPIRWAIYHPETSKQALIATELGVWSCADLTINSPIWTPDNNGYANVRTDMLRIRESDYTVLAASHGRGLFTTTFEPSTVGIEKIENNYFSVYPNPSNGNFSVDFSEENNEPKTLVISNIQGQIIYEETFANGKRLLSLSNLLAGNYVLTIKTSNNHYAKMITIN